jgi:hypothetical protein
MLLHPYNFRQRRMKKVALSNLAVLSKASEGA